MSPLGACVVLEQVILEQVVLEQVVLEQVSFWNRSHFLEQVGQSPGRSPFGQNCAALRLTTCMRQEHERPPVDEC